MKRIPGKNFMCLCVRVLESYSFSGKHQVLNNTAK